jgi:hypothetical protein
MIFNDSIWKNLAAENPTGEKLAARLAVPEKSKKLYVGFDAGKKRHLLVPLTEKDKEYNDSQSRGLSVATRNLVVLGSEPKRYIDITCQDDSGHSMFDIIGNEIAENVDKGESYEIISAIIGKWRHFWGQSAHELLSYEELSGLFAELWFLYYWLLPRINKKAAVARWRGPFSSRHDFEWKEMSVEVKATSSVQSRIHRIHGIEQLAPPEKGKLFLFSLRIREEKGAKNTLPDFIALCQKKLKDDVEALSQFENNLAVAGYSPIHNEEYSKFRLRVVDEKLYQVTDEFPHLTPDSFEHGLPNGVSAIEYSVNLDGFDNLCIAKSSDELKIDFS